MPRILIGNVKGPQGEKGDTGATGAPGEAATIHVGTVETVTYGQPAAVTNTGTDYDAVFNFRIPQGAPGQAPTGMGNLLLDSMTESTAEYPVIAVDERGATVFGKIKKFLNDLLSAVTSINTNGLFKSNLVNGFTQTTPGVNALDAAAGKSLNDSLAKIGTMTESGWKSDIAIPGTGTVTEVATISLPAGTYVVFAAFSSTGTTKPERAYITYRYGSATTPSVIQNEDFIGRATLIIGFIVQLSSTGTVGASCRAWSAITCSGSIRAVRIK